MDSCLFKKILSKITIILILICLFTSSHFTTALNNNAQINNNILKYQFNDTGIIMRIPININMIIDNINLFYNFTGFNKDKVLINEKEFFKIFLSPEEKANDKGLSLSSLSSVKRPLSFSFP